MFDSSVRLFIFSFCAVSLVATGRVAQADPGTCRAAITKNAAAYAQKRAGAFAKCESRILIGKLPPGTNCELDPKTVAAVGNAVAKTHAKIAQACGGPDKTCADGVDETLASIGWDVGICPADGCEGAITHCEDISDCVICGIDQAVDNSTDLMVEELADASGDSSLLKCQRVLVKAASSLYRSRSKFLAKCWSAVEKGSATAPCPTPGDGKTATSISRAEAKLVKQVCSACGGGDKGCDGAAGGVAGTGGTDDLAVAAIGFAGTCPDVTGPGAPSSCGGAVTNLAGVVDCLLCAGSFEGQCSDLLANPFYEAYPASCVVEDDVDACETVAYSEEFALTDLSAWPSPWVVQPNVAVADIQGGRARLRPTLEPSYSLARMTAPLAPSQSDVEASFTFEFGDTSSQGIGFYVRQNGGHLQLTPTHGEGYAAFFEGYAVFGEGGGQQAVGLWKEVDGVEIALQRVLLPAGSILDGVRYRARYRVNQAGPTQTWLRVRFWAEADPEPSTWQVEILDNEPVVQNVSGGLAVDSWSRHTTGSPGPQGDIFVDDIEIQPLCNPLAGVGAASLVADNFSATPFQFTEGPRWRPSDGVLLFTDLNLNTIYQLTPPATISEFRTGSNGANGLANDINGDLLACEHATRRVSRTDSMSLISTVSDNYLGDAYHSPNDLAVRSDGTIYFTDPRYGMDAHGQPAELGFNGLFRVAPGGAVTAQWSGGAASGPNGVVLSPDEDVLYMADTSTGEILAWDVNPDGSLSNQSTFASGLITPDGLCMDTRGNLFVSQWSFSAATGSLEVFGADGEQWGSIPVGHSATNCGFGGSDAQTLYITAHEGFMSNQAGLYSVEVPIAGLH